MEVDETRTRGEVSGVGVAAGIGAVAWAATEESRLDAKGDGVEVPDSGGVGRAVPATGCSVGAVRRNMASIWGRIA